MLLTSRRLWVAVAGLSIDQLVAWGVLYYAYTVLSAPVAIDLGISRLHVAAAFSVCLLVAGWVGRYVGSALDARGTRGVLRAGALAAPLVFASIAAVRGMASLMVVFALLGVVQALALYEPAFRAVVDWCPDGRVRARAMLGLTIVGGLASTVFLPFTGWLVNGRNWREAVLVLAILLAVVIVPLRFSLPLSNRRGTTATPGHVSAPGSARRLAVGLATHSLASTGVFVYLMWHLVERGASLAGAAAIAGFAGAAQVPGRIVSLPLRRAVGSAVFLPALLVTQAASLVGVVVATGAIATSCVLIFGAASGMMTIERATLIVEWYGPARFGGYQGQIGAATSTARAVSPFAVEIAHRFVSYAAVFGLLGVILVLGAWACRSAASTRAREARFEA